MKYGDLGQNAWGHLTEVSHAPRSDTGPGSPTHPGRCYREKSAQPMVAADRRMPVFKVCRRRSIVSL